MPPLNRLFVRAATAGTVVPNAFVSTDLRLMTHSTVTNCPRWNDQDRGLLLSVSEFLLFLRVDEARFLLSLTLGPQRPPHLGERKWSTLWAAHLFRLPAYLLPGEFGFTRRSM